MQRPLIYIIMGVSGCGKSTIGKLLSIRLQIPFFDGDDFHPKENVDKMANGIPLNDKDRTEWLRSLNNLAKQYESNGAVIACSALKKKYRARLRKDIGQNIVFVYLFGTFKEILERLIRRKKHYMPAALLKSQFDALEPPKDAIDISIKRTPEEIVSEILERKAK